MTRRSSEHAKAREGREGRDGRPVEPEDERFREDEGMPENASRGEAASADPATDTRAEPNAEELAAQYLDQLQRLKAEFDNYRKRILREKEEWYQSAQAGVVQRLLPVVDDLRRARGHAQPDEVPDAAGLYLILKRFEDLLGQLGLEEQHVVAGMEFDPEQHEAVMTTSSSEIPEGQIVTVLEPGYLHQGRLLRRSKVSVSSGPPPE